MVDPELKQMTVRFKDGGVIQELLGQLYIFLFQMRWNHALQGWSFQEKEVYAWLVGWRPTRALFGLCRSQGIAWWVVVGGRCNGQLVMFPD